MSAAEEASPKLRVRRGVTELSRGKPCPHCQNEIPSDAVFCVHCGYDLQAQQIRKSARLKKRIVPPWSIKVAAWLLVLLLGVIAFQMLKTSGKWDALLAWASQFVAK